VTGLPTGVNGNWVSGTLTISGTPSVAGTYSYTATTTGGCGGTAATGSIIVNGLPSISSISIASICPGATAGSLSYSSSTNNPNQYSIVYTGAPGNGFTNVSFTGF